jgi:hypothetical protein
MTLRLVALRSSGLNDCLAEFDRGEGLAGLTVEFHVDSSSGLDVVTSTPYIFDEYEGSVPEHRQLVRAVIAFCYAAARDGLSPGGD